MKYNPDIIKSNRKTVSLEIRADGKLTVRAPQKMTYKEIEAFVNSRSEWIEKTLEKYRNITGNPVTPYTAAEIEEFTRKAKEIIPERVKFFAGLMGVTYGKVSIRHPKTMWGSCSSKGNLSFSCLLTQMPPEILDSVVVHELSHRKHMNHSKAFYDEILRIMPDYRERERWLKENGLNYSRRLPK